MVMGVRDSRDPAAAEIAPRLALKAMPPHGGKQALARPRLLERLRDAAEQPLVALVTQAGFGKTSLLVQLRRELLAAGGAVAWLTVEARDDTATYVTALDASVRTAAGLALPVRSLDQSGRANLWIASELLVHIHDQARPTYLLIDDLHHLGDAQALAFTFYLITNAPPNFHIVIASRSDPPFPLIELQARGLYTRFVTDDLRFRMEDSIAVLRRRFGDGIDIDACARLHERTEGWPLGLQIIIGAMDRHGDVVAAAGQLSGASGDVARYFCQYVLERLAPAAVEMLVRSSLLKALRPVLCELLGGSADSRLVLAELEQNTGLVSSVEGGGDIYRLHPLFAEFLKSRAEALPAAELRELHRRAAEWYADQDMLEEAADHAFLAGMQQQAMDWIESRLHHLGAQGRLLEVLAWLDRLPPAEVTRREGIQLTAAWACALCYRPDEAERLAKAILARPGVTPAARLQANIVRSAVAIHCDDYRGAASCIADCDAAPGPLHCNSLSYIALHTGAPEKSRHYQQLAERGGAARSFYDAMYGSFAVGLSYLLEGRATEAESQFRRSLAVAESGTGWRSLPAAMQAAGLAAACWELGGEEEARALLANRLDLIEQAALPDAVILAYLTLARYENLHGREGKAQDALNSLAAIGEMRHQPRLVAMSLGEQLRQQAARHRLDACRPLLAQLTSLVDAAERPDRGLEAELQLIHAQAVVRVAQLEGDIAAANAALARAAGSAEALHRGRDAIAIRVVAAAHAAATDHESLRRLAEALSLAQSFGLRRVLADDAPAAAACLAPLQATGLAQTAGLTPAFVEAIAARCQGGGEEPRQAPARPRLAQLSVREMEILGALALGRSNKEIAKMLDVGPETIKWHVKNLFSKLSAVNRRHAVDRARLLGIID